MGGRDGWEWSMRRGARYGWLGAILLGACASNPLGGVFGGDDAAESQEAEADGDGAEDDGRIAVLAAEDPLQPDLRFVGQAVAIPPAFANTDWTQPGGEPDHTMHNLAGPSTFGLAWRAKIGEGGDARSPLTAPPVVAGDTAYALDNEARVTAYDTQTGAVRWSTALTPDVSEDRPFYQVGRIGRVNADELGFGGGIAIDGSRLFMVTGFGTAAAFDRGTGEVLWEARMPAPVRNPPTAAAGHVFAITTGNQAIALDQETGEVAWTYESFEETARLLSSASPAVEGGTVVVPFSSGEVVALQAENGRPLWNATVSRSSRMNAMADLNDIAGSPVLDRGAVFAISHSGQLSAIDLRTGREVWEVPVGGLNTPWIAGDTLFLVTLEGQLVALSRQDGAVRWVRQLDAYENPAKRKNPVTWSGPVMANGNLLLHSSRGGLLLASAQDGSTVDLVPSEGGTLPPIVAGGTVYLLDGEGRLNAYRDDGAVQEDRRSWLPFRD